MSHVGEGIPEGMRSLLVMLDKALQACRVEPRINAAWDYIGYNCDRGGCTGCFWVGLDFDCPSHLWFDRSLPPRGRTRRLTRARTATAGRRGPAGT
jgi:hypothetical protein